MPPCTFFTVHCQLSTVHCIFYFQKKIKNAFRPIGTKGYSSVVPPKLISENGNPLFVSVTQIRRAVLITAMPLSSASSGVFFIRAFNTGLSPLAGSLQRKSQITRSIKAKFITLYIIFFFLQMSRSFRKKSSGNFILCRNKPHCEAVADSIPPADLTCGGYRTPKDLQTGR